MTAAVQVTHRCAACGAWVPINGVLARVGCPGCSKVILLSQAGWKMLLEDVLRNVPSMSVAEGRTNPNAWTPDGQFHVSYSRTVVRCEACKVEMPMERVATLAARGSCACVSCGRRVSVRGIPAGFDVVLPGVSFVVGEDLDQLAAAGDAAAQAAREPIAIPCSQCGSSLAVDGSSRMVPCRFCGTQNMLPDQLWLRLHPVKTTTWWYLCEGGQGEAAVVAAAVPAVAGAFSWGSALSAVADPEGNLYVAEYGRGEDGTVDVFSLEPRGYSARWIQRGVKMKTPCELVMGWGELLLWNNKRHGAHRFELSTGRPMGELGGMEPEGTPVRMLDLRGAASFTLDAEGGYVVFIHNRVLRYGPDGRGVPTWPGARENLGPLYRNHVTSCPEDYKQFYDEKLQRLANAPPFTEVKWAKDVSHQPRALTAGFLKGHVGWDGCLYMLDWSDKLLLRFDRAGKMMYRAQLPLDDVDFSRTFGSDAAGNAFVLGESTGGYRSLVRVTPDGRNPVIVFKDRRIGGPLDRSEKAMAIAPDGRVWTIGQDGILHAFGRDGAVVHVSEAARHVATRAAGDPEDDDD
jgi:hypothetical protein